MRTILTSPYGLILFALILSGVELFVWFYLAAQGMLQQMIEVDASHVSLVILLIYTLASLWFLKIAFNTSRQYRDIDQPATASDGLIKAYFRDTGPQASQEIRQAQLDVLDTRLRSGYAFGFIVADLMLKLGLLGTVIGFIIMLGSLTNLNSVDITVMQSLLADMSSGMKVALYTTLVGMLAGIALNIKFNLLDWSVDHLLNDIKEKVSRESSAT
jgi:biopolymer transport protein ExbB/TolQ